MQGKACLFIGFLRLLESSSDECNLVKSKVRHVFCLILSIGESLTDNARILTSLVLVKPKEILSCRQTAFDALGNEEDFEFDLL